VHIENEEIFLRAHNRGACVAAILLVSGVLAIAQVNLIRGADLLRLHSVVDVQLSRDGARLAYTMESYDRPGRPYQQVWIMDLGTRESIRVGSAESSSDNPRWSPDGSKLAYLAAGGDARDLTICSPDGTAQRILAHVLGTNSPQPSAGEALSWSPDGKQIAYVSATEGPEAKNATGDPIVITRYLYKPDWSEGNSRFNDNRRLHIFIVDVDSKHVRQLTSGNTYEHSVDWSPISSEILFVSNHETDPDQFFNYDIFTVNADTGTVKQLVHSASAEYSPRWSPNGKLIAYLGTRRMLTSSETTMEDTHVWVMDADGGNRREVGVAIDNRQDSLAWSWDSNSVYTAVEEKGSVHLYQIALGGGKPVLAVDSQGELNAWSLSKDGKFVFSCSSPSDLAQAYLRTRSRDEKLTEPNTAVLNGKQLGAVEGFTFESYDGQPVEAYLTKPLTIVAGSKYPLILEIHGGPHAQQGPGFNVVGQVYASLGWATLMVNYRGSTGYGQRFADAIARDQDGGEAKDVIYGVKAALGSYAWLDPDRLAIGGVSYGGQLTDWIITQTNMFKAAVPRAGISNLVSFNYMAYYHDYLAVEFGAYPHQENLMDELWQRSALRYVARVHTPVMFLHGENDNDVPIAETEQYYIALKDVGVETVMVRYPREGHDLQEPRHIVDFLDRSAAWYRQHFTPRASVGDAVSQ